MAKCNIKRGKSKRQQQKQKGNAATKAKKIKQKTENNESKTAAKQSCKDKSARILEILFIYISLVPSP